jgi:hypothetical protein
MDSCKLLLFLTFHLLFLKAVNVALRDAIVQLLRNSCNGIFNYFYNFFSRYALNVFIFNYFSM